MHLRYSEEEENFINQFMAAKGLTEKTIAIRLLIKTALQIEGIKVPATAFQKAKEGRPSRKNHL